MPCAYIGCFPEIAAEYVVEFFRIGSFTSVRPLNAFIVIVVIIIFAVNVCFILPVNKVTIPGVIYHPVKSVYKFLIRHPVYLFGVSIGYPVENRKFNIVKLVIENVAGYLLRFRVNIIIYSCCICDSGIAIVAGGKFFIIGKCCVDIFPRTVVIDRYRCPAINGNSAFRGDRMGIRVIFEFFSFSCGRIIPFYEALHILVIPNRHGFMGYRKQFFVRKHFKGTGHVCINIFPRSYFLADGNHNMISAVGIMARALYYATKKRGFLACCHHLCFVVRISFERTS